jgi:type 1 glutamine amidotransferase
VPPNAIGPWYRALVGGTFDFHPPLQHFMIRVLDKSHASTAFFEQDTWSWEDEFYFLKERNDKVRVLLAGDVKSLKNRGKNPEKLSGQPDPYPLVWCHEFEGGRVWFTALGHKKEHYQDPLYLKHLLGGILWVIREK